jgi:hypothetical protein
MDRVSCLLAIYPLALRIIFFFITYELYLPRQANVRVDASNGNVVMA